MVQRKPNPVTLWLLPTLGLVPKLKTLEATSQWIRLADKGGKGFAESAPLSPDYDHTTLKYNAKGEQVSYLKGETVKIPAHWSSPVVTYT